MWQFGQIVQDTNAIHHINYASVHTDNPLQSFYRAVGGDTIASIFLDPDYNLAVEPATNNGGGQIGKFRITLNPAPASARTVVYRISGTSSNGVDYTNLTGTVSVP